MHGILVARWCPLVLVDQHGLTRKVTPADVTDRGDRQDAGHHSHEAVNRQWRIDGTRATQACDQRRTLGTAPRKLLDRSRIHTRSVGRALGHQKPPLFLQ